LVHALVGSARVAAQRLGRPTAGGDDEDEADQPIPVLTHHHLNRICVVLIAEGLECLVQTRQRKDLAAILHHLVAADPLEAIRRFIPRRRVRPTEGMPRFTGGAVGALALTAERVEGLVEALVTRGGMERDDARSLVDDLTGRWRTEAKRVGRASSTAQGLLRELGLVTKADVEELELRIAQLEHRLRLLEGAKPPAS